MKIGIFDSGIGGISVLHEACGKLPDAEYIFYAIQRLADDGEPISEIVLNTPSPYMESFPYCECTVTFNLTIAADIRGRNGSRLCEML